MKYLCLYCVGLQRMEKVETTNSLLTKHSQYYGYMAILFSVQLSEN